MAAPMGAAVETKDRFDARLAAAADHVEELDTAVRDARDQRNRIILEAMDAGMSYRQVGEAARVTRSQVHRVLARGFEEAS